MPRPHVAILAATGALGGAERSLVALISAAAGEMRFTVLLPEAGELGPEAASAGASVRVTPWSRSLLELGERNGSHVWPRLTTVMPALWQAVRTLRKSVAEIAPDVVVTNGIKPHLVGALAVGRSAAWPLIWYLRESLEDRRLSRTLLAPISGRCSGAIAISRYVGSDAQRYVHASVPVSVIYNIIDSQPHQPASTSLPHKDADTLWFATIGALTPLKGHDLFLRAAARISEELPAARFLIVGGAGYRTETHLDYERVLRDLAIELNISTKTLFLGHRNDVSALLEQIDVVIQPNRGPEGFGRSVAEAMAAGVPVIASDGWSLSELVENGKTGWLVPSGDVSALSERMLLAGRDRELRREIAQQGIARARDLFSTSSAVARFSEVVAAAARGKAS